MTEPPPVDRRRLQLRLVGSVQGVGFRPFVHRLAADCTLDGWVRNDGDGVTIEVEGAHERLLSFLARLPGERPAASTILAAEHRFLPAAGLSGFEIRASEGGGVSRVWVLPDLAMCGACRSELFDPDDRRYRYPFINCTDCGPRFTIIEALPYDRARTTMRGFTMCAECAREYADPSDRRFHAQPDACPTCGPRTALVGADGAVVAEADDAVRGAVDRLRDGGIVGVKGIGGYHIVVDAGNEAAVAELRRRKRRSHKAFAVMEPDLAALERHVELPDHARPLLTSTQAPILLLRRTAAGEREIAPSVAPDSPWLGVFLPYTPLHALILRDLGRPVVATSGNLVDEPIQHLDDEAAEQLGRLCDLLLTHDRPIVRPADDSVIGLIERPRPRTQMLRRARGYAPLPLLAPRELPPLVALGGQMNATLALSRGREVIVSQHLGDLDGFAARQVYRSTLDDLLELHGVDPGLVAHDLHPDYATTAIAAELGLPRLAVQHHHAHLAACMLDNELEGETLGITWDGTGYGPDGTVWGGELLLGDAASYRRVGSLVPFALPGGEAAVRQPWRVALALLHVLRASGEPAAEPRFDGVSETRLRAVAGLARIGPVSPATTSVGRLFDGVAALLGLCVEATHQAHAAQRLEWSAWSHGPRAEPLPLPVVDGDPLRLDWRPAIAALLRRRDDGEAVGSLAAAFHHALAGAAVEAARRVGCAQVALAGGVFCNRYLTELLAERLEAEGLRPHLHAALPPTDGSLSAGQLWVAAASTR